MGEDIYDIKVAHLVQLKEEMDQSIDVLAQMYKPREVINAVYGERKGFMIIEKAVIATSITPSDKGFIRGGLEELAREFPDIDIARIKAVGYSSHTALEAEVIRRNGNLSMLAKARRQGYYTALLQFYTWNE